MNNKEQEEIWKPISGWTAYAGIGVV